MSNQNANGNSPARWRTVNACRRCRQRKVKCSGVAPCRNCAKGRQHCVFDEANRRIVISERHLRDLERRATNAHTRPPRSANNGSLEVAMEEMNGEADRIGGQHASSMSDPNAGLPHIEPSDSPSQMMQNSNSTGIHNKKVPPAGHLVTWDFSRQLKEILGIESSEVSSSSQSSYKIPLWDDKFLTSFESPLPPKIYITHLAHVADFHMNTNHHFFDMTDFINHINKTSSQTTNTMSGAWKAKLLMITALGKLFLEKGATTSGPPGIGEFLTAIRDFLPHDMVDEDPVTTVEVLCLLTAYAQAADMHRMAYLYIGQASRIARAWKLDSDVNMDTRDNAESTGDSHTQRLWLTVCAMDRRLSATIGASSDTDVQKQSGLPIPSNNYLDNVELRLSVSLANTLSLVARGFSKYRIEDALGPPFINEITGDLTYMRSLGEQMKNIQPLCSNPSLVTISRQVATLHLLFYQAIMICIRPVLMCLMKPGLQEQELLTEQNASFETMFKILRTCINAATCTLSIISALYEQSLLETFMPLDMEMAFLAALCLAIANKVFPSIVETSFIDLAQKVLQYMSHTGSIPARLLQKELELLCRIVLDHQAPTNQSLLFDTFLNNRVEIIRDGVDLAEAIYHVIEIQSPNNFLASNASELIATSQQRPSLEVPTLTTATTVSLQESSHEFQMDGMGPVENSFSFDMADLQWLDCVQ